MTLQLMELPVKDTVMLSHTRPHKERIPLTSTRAQRLHDETVESINAMRTSEASKVVSSSDPLEAATKYFRLLLLKKLPCVPVTGRSLLPVHTTPSNASPRHFVLPECWLLIGKP